jgi:hypothetical protein
MEDGSAEGENRGNGDKGRAETEAEAGRGQEEALKRRIGEAGKWGSC